MKTVTTLNIICSVFVFIANIILVRFFGLEVKGELAKIIALIGLYTSFMLAPLTINSPKNILSYRITDLIVSFALPTIIFIIGITFYPLMIDVSLIVLIIYALTSFSLTIMSVRMTLTRQLGPLAVFFLSLPFSVTFFCLSGVKLTITSLVLTMAITQLLSLIWSFVDDLPKHSSDESVFFRDYLESYKFVPFTLFSGAPVYFSQIFLMEELADVAILSILFSVTQIIFKFTRNMQIWVVGTGESVYKLSDLIFHLVILFAVGIAGFLLINYFYGIPYAKFGLTFLILTLSNIFALNISRSDSILIRAGKPYVLGLQKAVAFSIFIFIFFIIELNDQLLEISVSFAALRIVYNLFAARLTGRLL